MAHCPAAVESRHPAGETFRYLATFSNAAEWDRACLPGNSRIRARSGRAAASGWWCRPLAAHVSDA